MTISVATFSFFIDHYELQLSTEQSAAIDKRYFHHAQLVDTHTEASGEPCMLKVSLPTTWPFLIVAQTYRPAGYGWYPGVMLIAETQRLFVGAGERLLCYDLAAVRRLWVDSADTGFYRWQRHNDIVLMSAELELVAWDSYGRKLWSRFVEPPWSYTVEQSFIRLDIMGTSTLLALHDGATLDA